MVTYMEKAITSFISQTTISIYTAGGETAGGNTATEALSNFVTGSKVLPQKFLSACHQKFLTGKQLVQIYYFNLLGYGVIFRKKHRFEDRNLKELCIKRMKEASGKLKATASS